MLCGDGVQCAGCVGAHLRGLYRKVAVMQEGHNTISWRPSEMRNPRLVVDVQDQLSTKAVSETLRARAYGRCQQLTYKLHAHLGLRSSAFLQGACLLLLLQPATPATTAHRRGAHPEPTSPEPERGRPAWSLEMSWRTGRKRQVPLDFWLYRPSPAIDLVFRSLLAKTLEIIQD